MKVDKHHTNRPISCPYKKQQLESNHPEKLTKPQSFGYSQAYALLQAIELNRRQRLSRKCLAHLALFVSQAWEDKPCQEKIQQLYYMMNNLLDTTCMDLNEPFETSLSKFCQNPVSTPTICPSVTLLIAISYVERLNKRYRDLKGTPGCGSRMIMVAFIMASKYIHDSLKLIIYTNNRKSIPYNNNNTNNYNKKIEAPITPPTSPRKMPMNINTNSANTTIQSINAALSNNTTTNTAHLAENSSATAAPIIPTPVSSPNPNPETVMTSCTSTSNTSTAAAASVTTAPTMTPDRERNLRIARMEQEFLFFLNYDLSVQDPSLLVRWAQSYQVPENLGNSKEEYTSADDADDEMDDEEEVEDQL